MNSFRDSRAEVYTYWSGSALTGARRSGEMPKEISNGENRAVTFIKIYRKSLKVVGILFN